mmetsp:Transcript_4554/g.11477  ORF Transcript_4554/g.11477 Transcript_4554/m.11477 type:complete len:231 (+) Transcript_4554:277-969(+)|eukprot:CAMPEP_0181088016 /NCGR_PEP_ID=MMETSP1071-20121207/6567_1 /TAXON_ID=35127 /ORGANISM="Thalassiosira sp., Strain NH16" /LENGTH=230 /DNA_ID=CAMNT_0023169915 /DNA_START=251 /DNA_END=946 /DNA_ORIENTATION=+
MNRVFGRKKAPGPPPPSLGEASSGVGNHMESMDVKIAQLDKELKGYRDKLKTTKSAAAKKNIQKRAMEVLKRKRMYETQRDQLAGQQFNIDQAAFGIESAKASVSTVAAMKAANTELKAVIKNDLKIDDVDELADDMAEMMDEFQEINEALAQNFSTPDDIDEADLEAELDMLEDEFEDELGETDAVPSYLQETTAMPPTPTGMPGANLPVAAGGGGGQKVDEYGLPVET